MFPLRLINKNKNKGNEIFLQVMANNNFSANSDNAYRCKFSKANNLYVINYILNNPIF